MKIKAKKTLTGWSPADEEATKYHRKFPRDWCTALRFSARTRPPRRRENKKASGGYAPRIARYLFLSLEIIRQSRSLPQLSSVSPRSLAKRRISTRQCLWRVRGFFAAFLALIFFTSLFSNYYIYTVTYKGFYYTVYRVYAGTYSIQQLLSVMSSIYYSTSVMIVYTMAWL